MTEDKMTEEQEQYRKQRIENQTKRKWPWRIAVDYDGVIHSYTSKWTHHLEILDPPVPGAFDWMRSMQSAGVELVLFTARLNAGEAGQPMKHEPAPFQDKLEAAGCIRAWFNRHGGSDIIEKLEFAFHGKPHADLYVDDRAWGFHGLFPTMEDLHAIQQWNKGAVREGYLDYLDVGIPEPSYRVGEAHQGALDHILEGVKELRRHGVATRTIHQVVDTMIRCIAEAEKADAP